jgi:hypothetical protein
MAASPTLTAGIQAVTCSPKTHKAIPILGASSKREMNLLPLDQYGNGVKVQN